MGSIYIKNNLKTELTEVDFPGKRIQDQEKVLQKYLEDNLKLLQHSYDMPLKLVKSKVKMDTGECDIFLIDNQGLPIIVEVKLKKNKQSKREVVGQIIDYASALSLLTFDQLNRRVGNSLEQSLRSISQDEVEYLIKRRFFEKKLKSGQFRLIIVVDAVPNELLREWLYENSHTDNDVRLVEIKNYSINKDEELLISHHLISYEAHRVVDPNAVRPSFGDVVDWYNNKISNKEYVAQKRGPTNYSIEIPHWPKGIHYEFNDWTSINQISIELILDIRVQQLLFLKEILHSFGKKMTIKNLGRVQWCPNRNNWARIAFLFNGDYHPGIITEGMKALIDQTMDVISSNLKNNKIQ
jgi:hypothetical protein